MNIVARKEKKFLITIQEAKKQEAIVNKVMAYDKNAGRDGYIVRSLYFDTLNDKDYEDKQAGIETRRKIRLRNYGPNTDFAILEIKQKQGDDQLKRSLRLKKEDAVKLVNRDYSCLLRYKEPFAAECYALMNMCCYKPKAIVQYNRKPFVAKENKIRVTFDSNLVGTESSFDIFDSNLKMYPLLDIDKVVLEVKYNGFLLSYIKDILDNVQHLETSVSKYCLARMISKKYVFL